MAHIYKRGKYYWLKYNDAGKVVRKSLKVTSKAAAGTLLLEYQIQEAKQRHKSELLVTKKPISEVFDEYIENRAACKRTERWYRYGRDCFMEFCRDQGLKHVADITMDDVERFYQGRKKGLYLSSEAKEVKALKVKREGNTPGAARTNLRALKYALNYAVEKRYINENPAKKVKLDKATKKIFRSLTFKEIDAILAMARKSAPAYYPILATAYYAGLRLGELVYLRPDEVDLDKNIVRVVSKPENPIKDRQERRIPLAKKLKAILKPLILKARRSKAEWLFTTKDGRPRANNLYRKIARIGKLAKVDTKGLNVQVFRETFGSHLREKGVDIALISEYLGHSSIKVTIDHYAHIEIENTHDQVDLL